MQLKTEVRSLTGLRGIAAIHVVLFHYFAPIAFSNPTTTFLGHGYLEVDLFFILSGFVMGINYAEQFRNNQSLALFLNFLGRRIARIYPLYFLTTLVAYFLFRQDILKDASVGRPSFSMLTINLLMIQSWGLEGSLGLSLNGAAWSISTEWAAYLLFPGLVLACLHRRAIVAWSVAILSVSSLAFLTARGAELLHNDSPYCSLHLVRSHLGVPVLRCISEFSLGLLALRLAQTNIGRAIQKTYWIQILIYVIILASMTLHGGDLVVVLLLPVAIISLMPEANSVSRVLSSKLLQLLGQLSYGIYLVHLLLTGLLIQTNSWISGLGFRHSQTYAAALGLLLTIALSYAAYNLIELPMRRKLQTFFSTYDRKVVRRKPTSELTSIPGA